MATARTRTEKVVVTEDKAIGITLDLTYDEAFVLFKLTRVIGGAPSTNPRCCLSSIEKELNKFFHEEDSRN